MDRNRQAFLEDQENTMELSMDLENLQDLRALQEALLTRLPRPLRIAEQMTRQIISV